MRKNEEKKEPWEKVKIILPKKCMGTNSSGFKGYPVTERSEQKQETNIRNTVLALHWKCPGISYHHFSLFKGQQTEGQDSVDCFFGP